MNKYVKEFLLRGMLFSGLGPIVLGIVFLILNFTISDFSLNGVEVFIAIISTYLLAFVQAGTSVFHQIEHWSPLKSAGFQLLSLYLVYLFSYLINSWIPLEVSVIIIFTIIFLVTYLIIWLITYFMIKKLSKNFNKKIIR